MLYLFDQKVSNKGQQTCFCCWGFAATCFVLGFMLLGADAKVLSVDKLFGEMLWIALLCATSIAFGIVALRLADQSQ